MHTATHDDLSDVEVPLRREPDRVRRVLGDIGGTWSRFALHGGDQVSAARDRRRNERFASPGDAIRHPCSENHARPEAAALAVAGPPAGTHAAFTHRDWQVDVATLVCCSADTWHLVRPGWAWGKAAVTSAAPLDAGVRR